VHSVFAGAMNLRPSAGGDGFLLSLVDGELKAHPRAAVVPGTRFDEWGVSPGDAGAFDGTLLRFGASGVQVRLPAARRARAEESPSPGGAGPDPETDRRLAAALEAVGAARAARGAEPAADVLLGGRRGVPDAPGSYSARFGDGALALAAAVAERSEPAFLRAARSVAGLGPGLTPAGDDFLCGYLAGLRTRVAADAGLERFLDSAGTSLTDAERGITARTNEISAAFLAEAAAGRFACALAAFANAVVGGVRYGSVECAARRLASIGCTSGLDAALGFLFAYRDRLNAGPNA
jgi:hypothetical protein